MECGNFLCDLCLTIHAKNLATVEPKWGMEMTVAHLLNIYLIFYNDTFNVGRSEFTDDLFHSIKFSLSKNRMSNEVALPFGGCWKQCPGAIPLNVSS